MTRPLRASEGTDIRRDDPDLELATPVERRTWAIRYFGLCFSLGAAIFFTQRLLHGTVGGL